MSRMSHTSPANMQDYVTEPYVAEPHLTESYVSKPYVAELYDWPEASVYLVFSISS